MSEASDGDTAAMTANGPLKIQPQLGILESSGLIKLAHTLPELEYLFRHVLVQDATYGSLLKQERRRLHAMVADALEEMYPERRRELAAILALHREQAGQMERAIEHLLEAAQHAAERYAVREAHDFFDRAYRYLRAADGDDAEARRRRVDAGLGRVKVGWTIDPYPDSIALLSDVISDAEALGDDRRVSDAYFWDALIRQNAGETYQTSDGLRRTLDRARELAERSEDELERARAQAFGALGLIVTGHPREGAQLSEGPLEVMERAGSLVDAANVGSMVVFAYARLGDFAAAERALERTRRLAARGDPIAELDAELMASLLAFERGDLNEAIRLGSACARGGEELGATSCAVGSHLVVGEAKLRLGQPVAARAPLERSRQLVASGQGNPFMGVWIQAGLSSIRASLGEFDSAEQGFDAALEQARRLGDGYGEGLVLRQRAVSRASGPSPDWDALVEDLRASARSFEDIEARPQLSRSLRAYGEALVAAGRAEEATEPLRRADQIARDIGLRPEPPFIVRPVEIAGPAEPLAADSAGPRAEGSR